MKLKLPVIFVNHGGGPLPLLGKQPELAKHMREVVKLIPERPKSILVISAHWESNPIQITSSQQPSMYYDYNGFPPETYKYQYPAPGSPLLAQKVQSLLTEHGIQSERNEKRGYDHGVFVPLMLMYPKADIPVVSVSLHNSLDPKLHIQVGRALEPLREEGVLIVGSGYTFHNMQAFFHPTSATYKASAEFNEWLKDVILNKKETMLDLLQNWEMAPGARTAHPREEHLIPLLVTAAAGGSNSAPRIIYDVEAKDGEHAVSGYLFE